MSFREVKYIIYPTFRNLSGEDLTVHVPAGLGASEDYDVEANDRVAVLKDSAYGIPTVEVMLVRNSSPWVPDEASEPLRVGDLVIPTGDRPELTIGSVLIVHADNDVTLGQVAYGVSEETE